jgi:hypothetical protein
MRKLSWVGAVMVAVAVAVGGSLALDPRSTAAEDTPAAASPDPAAVERSRKTVQMLDNIYKQTVVLITDKYVHDEDDFPAGSAAVVLFERISETGSHQVRLIDATGEPYEAKNVARDDFERQGIKRLKAGAPVFDAVVEQEGKHVLRSITPIPVVMQKCVMCHPHYADAKKGEPVGAISYTIPIE